MVKCGYLTLLTIRAKRQKSLFFQLNRPLSGHAMTGQRDHGVGSSSYPIFLWITLCIIGG